MSMETLNTAARAAGFAMATSDEGSQESKVEAKPEAEAWRSARPSCSLRTRRPPRAKASAADWFKSLFGLFGRGAPA